MIGPVPVHWQICLSKGINKILTRNKKHFENIQGLEIIGY